MPLFIFTIKKLQFLKIFLYILNTVNTVQLQKTTTHLQENCKCSFTGKNSFFTVWFCSAPAAKIGHLLQDFFYIVHVTTNAQEQSS